MATDTRSPTLQSREDFAPNPAGQQAYWQEELKGSQKMLEKWHRQADLIHKRYLNELSMASEAKYSGGERTMPLNIFYSNVQTLISLLYGRVPQVDVSRRYSDANDDVGRVAALIMERLLNNEMANFPTQYDAVLRAVLEDRLVPGLGCARVRYDAVKAQMEVAAVVDVGGVEVAPMRTETVIVKESAPIDYFHWRDLLWSWARTPNDLRWVAFRTWATVDEATERYGKSKAEALEYKTHRMNTDEKSIADNPDDNDYWLKAEIWEIWDKQSRSVIDFAFGASALLRTQEDALELPEFFPAPPFLMANATTSLYKPTPDFHMSQDLYNEIDKLQTRIAIITEAVKVVGVYDKSAGDEVGRMLKEGVENDLIPVDQWAMFAEKGGLKGLIDWFPVESITVVLGNLRQLRDETIELLYQTSGMADVMRGTLQNQYEGVGQTGEKVKFGSVRVQRLQEDYATFASNVMTIKAQIISNLFEPETIADMANVRSMTEPQELIIAAIELIKDWKQARLQIKIKSESLALVDYARMRAERGEFMTGLSAFFTAVGPLLQEKPEVTPFVLEMLQWGMTGFRGGDEVEGIMDRAIGAAKQAMAQEQANPKPDAEQQKAQAAQQLEQMKAQSQLQAIQAKAQADMAIRENDKQADITVRAAEHQMVMAEKKVDFMAEAQTIKLKAMADVETEQATSAVNAQQQAAGVEAEMNKDLVLQQDQMDKEIESTMLEIEKARIMEALKPETDSEE